MVGLVSVSSPLPAPAPPAPAPPAPATPAPARPAPAPPAPAVGGRSLCGRGRAIFTPLARAAPGNRLKRVNYFHILKHKVPRSHETSRPGYSFEVSGSLHAVRAPGYQRAALGLLTFLTMVAPLPGCGSADDDASAAGAGGAPAAGGTSGGKGGSASGSGGSSGATNGDRFTVDVLVEHGDRDGRHRRVVDRRVDSRAQPSSSAATRTPSSTRRRSISRSRATARCCSG